MKRKLILGDSTRYLFNTPKTINWKIVAAAPGTKLTVLQDHDLVFDKYDMKIRGLL